MVAIIASKRGRCSSVLVELDQHARLVLARVSPVVRHARCRRRLLSSVKLTLGTVQTRAEGPRDHDEALLDLGVDVLPSHRTVWPDGQVRKAGLSRRGVIRPPQDHDALSGNAILIEVPVARHRHTPPIGLGED
jgi:hypothetical protein